MTEKIMTLTINIPDPPKNQCIVDISFHFQEGQLVEYTAPSGWVVKDTQTIISDKENKLSVETKCKECKKDWTKCGKCPVMMKFVKGIKSESEG